jgi:hypothetical protein
MAAAKAMSRPATLNGHKTNGILLDTLQLVAPRKELQQVPNHLLETSEKILDFIIICSLLYYCW